MFVKIVSYLQVGSSNYFNYYFEIFSRPYHFEFGVAFRIFVKRGVISFNESDFNNNDLNNNNTRYKGVRLFITFLHVYEVSFLPIINYFVQCFRHIHFFLSFVCSLSRIHKEIFGSGKFSVGGHLTVMHANSYLHVFHCRVL